LLQRINVKLKFVIEKNQRLSPRYYLCIYAIFPLRSGGDITSSQ